MHIIRHWDEPAARLGAVVALGNFDGVHRGHQAVIAETRAIAAGLGAPAGVLTFEPHPRQLFRPHDPPFRLTPFRIKARLIEALGLDVLYALAFDRAFSERSAESFIRKNAQRKTMPALVTRPILGRARLSLIRSGSIASFGIGAPGSGVAGSVSGLRDSAICPVGILSSRSTTRRCRK